jgi:hypothetical protein
MFQRSARSNRTSRRGKRHQSARARWLRVEALEDRSLPSANIPLSGITWTNLGPNPIVNGQTPGGLSVSGRVTGIAADPLNHNVIFLAAAGGGIWETTDAQNPVSQGGPDWKPLTDALTGADMLNGINLTEDQRALFMGSIAVTHQIPSGPGAAASPLIVYGGEGEANNSGDSFYGRGILKGTEQLNPVTGAHTYTFKWQLLQGPGNAFDRKAIGKIAIDPANPNILLAAVSSNAANGTFGSNGVWRSLDGGISWTNITVTIAGSTGVVFSDVALDPNIDTSGVAYVAIGNPSFTTISGVYRTTNALDTVNSVNWTPTLGGNGTFVPGQALGRIEISVAPSRPSTIYAIASTPQPPLPPGTPNADQFLAIFLSNDSGINWTQLPTSQTPNPITSQGNYNIAIAASPTDPNLAVAAGNDSGQTNTVIRTTPGSNGTVWTGIGVDANVGPHTDCHVVTFDADGNVLLGSDGGIFKYTLSGTVTGSRWTSLNGNPGSPTHLGTIQFVGVTLHPSDANLALGGSQDNGTERFFDDPTQTTPAQIAQKVGWTRVDSGDGGKVFYDPVNPSFAWHFAPNANGLADRSTDGGLTWAIANNGIVNPGSGLFYPAVAIDPSLTSTGTNRRLLLGTDVVNETTDSALSWHQMGPTLPYVTAIPAPFGPDPISAIGVGRQNRNIVYAAVSNRWWQNPAGAWVPFGPGLYVIDMAAGTPFATLPLFVPGQNPPVPTWFEVSPGMAAVARIHELQSPSPPFADTSPHGNTLAGGITSVTVDPSNSSVLYITTGNFAGSKVWRSTDFGQTWTDLTGTAGAGALPNLPVQSMALDPNLLAGPSDDDLYVGNDTGVWKLTNPTGGPFVWSKVGRLTDPITGATTDTLPNAQALDLSINTSLGILAVGTHGRGMWEFQIRPYVDGFKFNDLNGNGIRDVDPVTGAFTEPGVPGITIEAINTATNAIQASAVTDSQGFYTFRSLPDGTYRFVEVTPSGTIQTSIDPSPVTLDRTKTIRGENFGNFVQGTISGTIFNDVNGNGISPPSEGETGIGAPTFTVDLLRSDNDQPILDSAGQPVKARTDASGNYIFKDSNGQTMLFGPIQDRTQIDPVTGAIKVVPYKVRVEPQAGWVETDAPPHFKLVTMTSGQNKTGVSFDFFKLTSISGQKFEDHNGNGVQDTGDQGLQGWTFELRDSVTNALVTTATTDTSGNYTFTGLGPLQDTSSIDPTTGAIAVHPYLVKEVGQTGWVQTSASPGPIPVSSGLPVSNVNFGNFQLTSISGTKYEDHNANGTRDANDQGVSGVVFQLINGSTGAVITTATTGPTGQYTFANLGPLGLGNTIAYQVREVVPTGWTQTSAQPADIILSSGQQVTGVDIGDFKNTTITVHKFQDHNGDSLLNGFAGGPDEGLLGWGFQLINSATGAVISTQTTNVNGDTTFANLGPLQQGGPGGPVIPYRIREVPQAGWVQTTANPSDVKLQSGVPVSGITFGNFKLVNIAGSVSEDHNGNGIRDANDQGLGGWTVRLINAATGQPAISPATGQPITAVTDAAGNYLLTNVGPGTFVVQQVTQPGYVQTTPAPAPITTLSGQDTTGVAFGDFKLVNISGLKFEDFIGDGFIGAGDHGAAGFTFQLVNVATGQVAQSQVSDASGAFLFANVGPGTFRIREVPQAGWVQTTANPFDLTTASGVDTSGVTIGNFHQVILSGRAFEDLNGDGLLGPGEPGLPGWTVQLINVANGAVLDTRVTDAAGNYTFGPVGPGTFRVREVVQSGWVQSSANPADVPTQSGQNVGGVVFGDFRLGAVIGRKFNDLNGNGLADANEPGIPGVTVLLVNAATGVPVGSAVTDAAGNYVIPNLGSGAYVVREVPVPGFQQTSPPLPVFRPTSGQVVTGQNLGNASLTSISGHVYLDSNRDGKRELNEQSRANILVQILDVNATVVGQTLTAADGTFHFVNLPPAAYAVRIVPPGGFSQTQPAAPAYTVATALGALSPGNAITGLEFGIIGEQLFAVGAGASGGPQVNVYDFRTGGLKFSFFAYDPSFTGGVRVATGDVTGDGVDDVITAAGPTGGPQVNVYDGVTGNLVRSFFAYDAAYTGGVNVAVGDVNGDGIADIITGTGPGGGPHVKVFDGATGGEIRSFFAYSAQFLGGVNVAAADINGDGAADIITGAGPSGGPHVQVFDGLSGALIQSFFAFDGSMTAGVNVAAGDVNGDGQPDIIVGPGTGFLGSRTRVFAARTSALEMEFDAFPPPTGLLANDLYAAGVHVGTGDVNGDGRLDIVVGGGPGSGPRMRFFDGVTGAVLNDGFVFDPSFLGGIYVS